MSNSDLLAADVLVAAEVSAEAEQEIIEEFRALDVAARALMLSCCSIQNHTARKTGQVRHGTY